MSRVRARSNPVAARAVPTAAVGRGAAAPSRRSNAHDASPMSYRASSSSSVPSSGSYAGERGAAAATSPPGNVPAPLMMPGALELTDTLSAGLNSTITSTVSSAPSTSTTPTGASSTTPKAAHISDAAEMAELFRVVARVRPINENERNRGDSSVVHSAGDGQTMVVESATSTSTTREPASFTFNRCFDGEATQRDVFEQSGVQNLVSFALEGYASTVFAFGQTGSGKTFTISGKEGAARTPETDGVVPRCIKYLFDRAREQTAADCTTFRIRASYLEIYNEQVKDLLNTSAGNLAVRWNTTQGFFVENLLMVDCSGAEDLLAVFEEGIKNRSVAAHDMNLDSSRSHSMMTIYVDSETREPDSEYSIARYGKLTFCDLAGSERVKESRSDGERLTETRNINKSLLALGKCISTLGDTRRSKAGGAAVAQHVPYRDSKLTKLLMDSLGGNGIAMMIACCSPAGSNADESIKTLRYARRASHIKNKPVIKMNPHEQLIHSLKQELTLLRTENKYLRDAFRGSSPLDSPARVRAISDPPVGSPRSTGATAGGAAGNAVGSASSTTPRSSARPVGSAASAGSAGGTDTSAARGRHRTEAMLQEFIRENDRLVMENRQLHSAREQLERQYRQVMEENERLHCSLEYLERIFVDRNEVSFTPRPGARADRKGINRAPSDGNLSTLSGSTAATSKSSRSRRG